MVVVIKMYVITKKKKKNIFICEYWSTQPYPVSPSSEMCPWKILKAHSAQTLHPKLRQRNVCRDLTIFIHGKYLHLFTAAIDSEGILGNISQPSSVPLKILVSKTIQPEHGPLLFILTHYTKHEHAKRRQRLSGRSKG